MGVPTARNVARDTEGAPSAIPDVLARHLRVLLRMEPIR
jgi:hypothetical protein